MFRYQYLAICTKPEFCKNFHFLLKGIYRVCGNKIKTEKLCQALENGMHLVDISEFSSHDICDVLKLYLRQVKFLSLKLTVNRKEQKYDMLTFAVCIFSLT